MQKQLFVRRLFLSNLVVVASMSTGCSTLGKALKAWLGGDEQQVRPVTTPRFSDQENLRAGSERQYKRMNRQRLEEEAELKAEAGSLWVMEGQGAYLFSQNQMRMVGDLLSVKIEGTAKSQLVTKQRVISKLLERLEAPVVRGLASQSAANAQAAANAAGGAQAAGASGAQANAGQNEKGEGAQGAATAEGAQSAQAGKPELPFAVQTVPTRIVEQLKDGSYRVRGVQPFMIGKREYKVIVTGVVRPEDFDDAGIDAGKLLDSQFDIVSSRKGASL